MLLSVPASAFAAPQQREVTPAVVLGVTLPELAAETPAITEKNMTFYINSVDNVRTYPVYFMGDSDVPCFSPADFAELQPYLVRTYSYPGQDISYELSFSLEGETGTLMREDGYTVEFDCAADTITFFDYDAFRRPDTDRVLLDILSVDQPKSEEEVQYFRRAEGSYERYGDEVILDLAAYDIDRGADPDFSLARLSTFYDRAALTDYINNLP